MTKRDVVLLAALYALWLCTAYLLNLIATGARTPQAVFDEWVRFDAIYFRALAQFGYAEASRLTHPEIGFPYLTAFFPLFPLLIHLASGLFGGNYSVTSIIVAQTLTFLSVLALFKLVTLDFPRPVAWLSVAALITFPTSYFLLTSYSETLFLLLVILTFYFYRQQQLLSAGIAGLLAAATRIMGAPLLLGTFALDAARGAWRGTCFARGEGQVASDVLRTWQVTSNVQPVTCHVRSTSRVTRHPPALRDVTHGSPVTRHLSLALIPLGFLAYLIYQWLAFGNPWLFLEGHASPEWRVGFDPVGPIKGVVLPFYTLVARNWSSVAFRENMFNSLFFYFAIVMLIYTRRQLPFSYSIYTLLATGLPTFTGSLISMPRFLLISFPLFLSMGLWLYAHPRARLVLAPLALSSLIATYLFFKTVFLG